MEARKLRQRPGQGETELRAHPQTHMGLRDANDVDPERPHRVTVLGQSIGGTFSVEQATAANGSTVLKIAASNVTLSLAGVTSQSPEVVRAAYVGMNLIGWFIIVPSSLAALLSGIVQSLGTEWAYFGTIGSW